MQIENRDYGEADNGTVVKARGADFIATSVPRTEIFLSLDNSARRGLARILEGFSSFTDLCARGSRVPESVADGKSSSTIPRENSRDDTLANFQRSQASLCTHTHAHAHARTRRYSFRIRLADGTLVFRKLAALCKYLLDVRWSLLLLLFSRRVLPGVLSYRVAMDTVEHDRGMEGKGGKKRPNI